MASVCAAKGEGGTGETKEDGAVMEDVELENDEDVTKGERDEKSIVAAVGAARDSGCGCGCGGCCATA